MSTIDGRPEILTALVDPCVHGKEYFIEGRSSPSARALTGTLEPTAAERAEAGAAEASTADSDTVDTGTSRASLPPEKDMACDRDRRLQCVLDYQAVALTKDDPFTAAVATVGTGLMGTPVHMDESIRSGLDSQAASLDQIQKPLPTIQVYLQSLDRSSASRRSRSGATAAPPPPDGPPNRARTARRARSEDFEF